MGRRAFADVGHGRRLGVERGCTSTSAAAVPATAVAGLDGPIAAPAHDESTRFAAAPRAGVAAVRGVWAEREPAHRGCWSSRSTASPERVMAKPRAVSSSSARAGTRTVTVLRSLSLPPGAGARIPRHTSPGSLTGTVRPGCRRSRTARRRPRPQGRARRSLTSRGGVGRQPAAHSAWHRPLLRRAPTEASPFPEPLQQRCGPVRMTAPPRCPSARERNKQQTSPAMHANRPSISSGAWRSHADDVQPAPSSVRRTTRRRQRDRGPSRGLRVPRGCRRARAAVRNCAQCTRRHRASRWQRYEPSRICGERGG